MEAVLAKSRVRCGRRISLAVPLMLHWREPGGVWREVPAETEILSRHGCLLGCSARIKLTDELMVWWLEKMRYVPAHVVFRSINIDGSVTIALEFLGTDDFWGIDFHTGLEAKPCAPVETVLRVL